MADVAFEIEGATLDDLFATGARALAELAADPATLGGAVERTVTLEAPDVELLFYDWLAELVFLADRDRAVYPAADVTVTAGPPAHLRARVHGGLVDRARTALRADPKAVTMHRFRVDALSGGGWRAEVVIDV